MLYVDKYAVKYKICTEHSVTPVTLWHVSKSVEPTPWTLSWRSSKTSHLQRSAVSLIDEINTLLIVPTIERGRYCWFRPIRLPATKAVATPPILRLCVMAPTRKQRLFVVQFAYMPCEKLGVIEVHRRFHVGAQHKGLVVAGLVHSPREYHTRVMSHIC